MNVANWYCNLSLKRLPATCLKFNTRTQWCSYNYYMLYVHNFILSNKAITTFFPCILLKLQQRLCVLLQRQNHQYEHPGLWKKKKVGDNSENLKASKTWHDQTNSKNNWKKTCKETTALRHGNHTCKTVRAQKGLRKAVNCFVNSIALCDGLCNCPSFGFLSVKSSYFKNCSNTSSKIQHKLRANYPRRRESIKKRLQFLITPWHLP